MNTYITGTTIRRLREKLQKTQAQLAIEIGVSDKTVSKWETGRGLPDITLIEPLAKALRISVIELLSGENIVNVNRSGNMLKSRLYLCPVCNNVIHSTGSALVSCCGITLPPLEKEEEDTGHIINIQQIDGELYVSLDHEMSKSHHILFIALLTGDSFYLKKLYPEADAAARLPLVRDGVIYACCNKHGLFAKKI